MSGIRGEKYINESGELVVTGGYLTAKTVKERYGEDYYRNIGAKGGKATGIKGFAAMPKEKRVEAGRKGGQRSRRIGVKHGQGKTHRNRKPVAGE